MSDQTPPTAQYSKALQLTKAGQFQAAIGVLEEMGSALNNDVESLYVQAICLRKLKRYDEALHTLERLLDLDPKYLRAYQEVGHTQVAAGKLSLAIEAFEHALSSDSALIGSWRALVELYDKTGDKAKLDSARAELAQLEQLPPELQTVKSYLNRDNLVVADQFCRQYLQQHKQSIEGMRLLAEIGTRSKVLDDAEFILESAVAFEPTHIGARYDYANVLVKRQKFGEAHKIMTQLRAENPNNIQFRALYAATLSGVGETESAAKLYRELVSEKYQLDHTYLLLGHAEKTRGDLPAAIAAYQNLYKVKPNFGDAFWSLANTKTYRFSESEIAHMEDYRNRDETSVTDKVHFNFALGKAYEDLEDYARAFNAYSEGNELNKQILNYQSPAIEKRVARQKEVCNADLFERLKDVGAKTPDPIFVLGLPRAGSTLLEQILASHSQVDGTHELPHILDLSRRLRGRASNESDQDPQYPRILGELEHDYFRRFGEQYIDNTAVFRQGAQFFIDKMPNNFLHIGLIKLILPNAKVIDARRHPMACCFSGFKQLFAEGQDFTYGLAEIGHYYKNYVEVMDHWDKVLPGFVLRVQHEDVVSDLETQVRRMLEFCDLEFEDPCLEFYKTERSVRTPSSEQVRQPIYTTGLEQWRNFEAHLKPLIDALGDDVLARYPIS